MTPAARCTANTPQHDGREPRLHYALGIGGRVRRVLLCQGCAAASPDWRPDRRQDADRAVKSAADRRFVPRWLANLQGRDETGRMTA